MIIIAGLGNPGRKYDRTRHNAGFETIDLLAEKYGIKVASDKFRGLFGTGFIDGEKVMLLKPQTFMNLSGECIGPACDYYGVDPAEGLIVICDDINLPPGQLRVRRKGSAGGHNGLKSVIAHTGTQEFKRVRIGTGQAGQGELVDFVLGHYLPDERAVMEKAFERAAGAAAALVTQDAERVMSEYNRSITEEI